MKRKRVIEKSADSAAERLREIVWEMGQAYPLRLTRDYVSLHAVTPRMGFVHWYVRGESADTARVAGSPAPDFAVPVARVYDVTDIIFDGRNAHNFFDLDLGSLQGGHYFRIERPARNYLAEIGLRAADGSFVAIERSQAVFFDRERPSGNYQTTGMFVGKTGRRFSVESVFDAPVYERLNNEESLPGQKGGISCAIVFTSIGGAKELESGLGAVIGSVSERITRFGCETRLVMTSASTGPSFKHMFRRLEELDKRTGEQLGAIYARAPFDIIHCHDWYSAPAGLRAKKSLNIPLVLSVHSTEHERLHGNEMDKVSAAICEREAAAVAAADRVIVPHSSTRQIVINVYGASPDRVVIIPDPPDVSRNAGRTDPAEVRRSLGLAPDAPTALFAGEISHAEGADLLVEALPTVCRNHGSVQFIFAGDGPLRAEMEAKVAHAGLGRRCRFLGDVPAETFEAVLASVDFVVIPARTWQDEGLARMAIDRARPVLTTRQAGLNCIVHGSNGLVTFDNPGSMVWGIQEMLYHPLQKPVGDVASRRRAREMPSLESIAAQQYLCYLSALRDRIGGQVV